MAVFSILKSRRSDQVSLPDQHYIHDFWKDDTVSLLKMTNLGHINVSPERKTTTAVSEGGGDSRRPEQRLVSVMVAVTQKLTGWRDVKGEIYQD